MRGTDISKSRSSLYCWKANYGRLERSDSKRLKALEEENRKLNHM